MSWLSPTRVSQAQTLRQTQDFEQFSEPTYVPTQSLAAEEEEERKAPAFRARAFGAYGCVGSPVPRCTWPQAWETHIPSGVPTVAKVYFDPREATREWQLLQTVKSEADPRSEFTPRIFGQCAVDASKVTGHEVGCGGPRKFGGQLFVPQIVMEDSGVALSQLERPIPWVQFVGIISQTAAALQRLNAAGLLHNDVKAENTVYDTAHNRVSLIDFSLLTRTGELWGRWPEQRMSPPEWAMWRLFYDRATVDDPVLAAAAWAMNQNDAGSPPSPSPSLSRGTERVVLQHTLLDKVGVEEWAALRTSAVELMLLQRSRVGDLTPDEIRFRYSAQTTEFVDGVGTRLRLSAWRAESERPPPKSDVYALGSLVVQMLITGHTVEVAPAEVCIAQRQSLLDFVQQRVLTTSPAVRSSWDEIVPWLQQLHVQASSACVASSSLPSAAARIEAEEEEEEEGISTVQPTAGYWANRRPAAQEEGSTVQLPSEEEEAAEAYWLERRQQWQRRRRRSGSSSLSPGRRRHGLYPSPPIPPPPPPVSFRWRSRSREAV